jgi:hypothetical protein
LIQMKKNMALLKKASGTASDNVIEVDFNRITPFEDVDIELDEQDDKMLSREDIDHQKFMHLQEPS